jgi:hypothetical protein
LIGTVLHRSLVDAVASQFDDDPEERSWSVVRVRRPDQVDLRREIIQVGPMKGRPYGSVWSDTPPPEDVPPDAPPITKSNACRYCGDQLYPADDRYVCEFGDGKGSVGSGSHDTTPPPCRCNGCMARASGRRGRGKPRVACEATVCQKNLARDRKRRSRDTAGNTAGQHRRPVVTADHFSIPPLNR